jgi:hypothetical protein
MAVSCAGSYFLNLGGPFFRCNEVPLIASIVCTLSARRPTWIRKRPKPTNPQSKLPRTEDAAVDIKPAAMLMSDLYFGHPSMRLLQNQAGAAVARPTENRPAAIVEVKHQRPILIVMQWLGLWLAEDVIEFRKPTKSPTRRLGRTFTPSSTN